MKTAGKTFMKKEILKTVAGVMAATIFVSGCGLQGKTDATDEADKSETTEVVAEASTEETSTSVERESTGQDHLSAVRKVFEDDEDLFVDETDFCVDYKSGFFVSTSKWDDYVDELGYPEKYEENNKGFISSEDGYRWEMRYPASFQDPYDFRVVLVSPSMEREGADTYIDYIAFDQTPTMRGIKAGDSLEDVKYAYGKPNSIEPYGATSDLVSVVYSCETGDLEFVVDDTDTVKYIMMKFAKDSSDNNEGEFPEIGAELSFRGYYSYQGPEMPRFFTFEDSDYDVDFDSMIGVDLTSEQGDFVLANPYEEFEITFVLTEKSMYGGEIYHVEAKDIEIVKDNPSAGANYDASTDPLNGLVAEDILTKFRATNPVKDTDSIGSEARALGRWVRKTIGKDGFSEEIREQGVHIGNAYEFCFGTDIGNNFDNNLPGMYAVYYALKDYYTSDGVRNKEFYDGLVEDNEYLGNGDPERIKDMYQDLREFITACNFLIRERH
jgi:hypothetical protein